VTAGVTLAVEPAAAAGRITSDPYRASDVAEAAFSSIPGWQSFRRITPLLAEPPPQLCGVTV